MENGSRPAKSTGFTPSIKTGKGKGLAPVESTATKKASPVLTPAPMTDVFLNFAVEVSASRLLAVQMMMGDFKELKAQLSDSWQASSNGKIYWCAEMPGHRLSVEDGNLLVDGESAGELLEKLLVEKEPE